MLAKKYKTLTPYANHDANELANVEINAITGNRLRKDIEAKFINKT